MTRKYGWRADLPDIRDFRYSAPRGKAPLPKKVDLRFFCSAVEDQGNVGSCSGQAFAAILEYLDRKGDGKYVDVSRLFIYYNERKLEGTVGEDSGALLRDGIKSLAKWGACDEKLWPYQESIFLREPSSEAYQDALKRKIVAYYRVSTLDDVKSALAEGLPVVFGFSVYESFESGEVAKTGMVSMPERSERMMGGHAVVAVGYDDDLGRVIVRNSWGEAWGDRGYFYLPYGYIESRDLSDDFWVILGTGLKFIEEEPFETDIKDAKWYIPITTIIKIIGTAWTWIFGSKQSDRRAIK
jgi:C1A family cysteine protease